MGMNEIKETKIEEKHISKLKENLNKGLLMYSMGRSELSHKEKHKFMVHIKFSIKQNYQRSCYL